MWRCLSVLVGFACAGHAVASSVAVLPPVGGATGGPACKTRECQIGKCLVNSGEAVSDAMDAALFIWASTKRCGKAGEQAKCAIDVASAVKSVNSMIDVVAHVMDQCDALTMTHKACAMTAGALTKHTAGLAAATAEVYQKCSPAHAPTDDVTAPSAGSAHLSVASPVMCTIDLKDTAKDAFKAARALMMLQSSCKNVQSHAQIKDCASNILQVVGTLAGVGEYLAGAIGHCESSGWRQPTPIEVSQKAECTEAIEALVHHTTETSMAGIDIAKQCDPAGLPPMALPPALPPLEEEGHGHGHGAHFRAVGPGFLDPLGVPAALPTMVPPVPLVTLAPTFAPVLAPTPAPTSLPTAPPVVATVPPPTPAPTLAPTPAPTLPPTPAPTPAPTLAPAPPPVPQTNYLPVQTPGAASVDGFDPTATASDPTAAGAFDPTATGAFDPTATGAFDPTATGSTGTTADDTIQTLYSKDGGAQRGPPLGFLALALGAFLPVTMVVSFFGGRFYATGSLRSEDRRQFMVRTPREVNLNYFPTTPRLMTPTE